MTYVRWFKFAWWYYAASTVQRMYEEVMPGGKCVTSEEKEGGGGGTKQPFSVLAQNRSANISFHSAIRF